MRDEHRIFERVAARLGFAATAREVGLSPVAVTRALAQGYPVSRSDGEFRPLAEIDHGQDRSSRSLFVRLRSRIGSG